jgi:hypothetical protein
MSPPLLYLALFAAGLVAGALNVVAGGGTFLTLPLLIFAGLPPTVANGTNRVAILVQNVGAVWGFDRHKVLERSLVPWTALPSIAGAALGSWAALVVGDESFQRALAVLMVAISLWTLWDPIGRLARRRRLAASAAAAAGAPAGSPPAPPWSGAGGVGAPVVPTGAPSTARASGAGELGAPAAGASLDRRAKWLLAAAFFAVGVYGGFVQAGVGFLILAATTWAGLDLVRGNALKVLVVLAYIPLSLAIFAWEGKVVWGLGLVLAAGHLAGAFLGVHLTVLKGHRWVQRVVTVAVIAFAVKLWFD